MGLDTAGLRAGMSNDKIQMSNTTDGLRHDKVSPMGEIPYGKTLLYAGNTEYPRLPCIGYGNNGGVRSIRREEPTTITAEEVE